MRVSLKHSKIACVNGEACVSMGLGHPRDNDNILTLFVAIFSESTSIESIGKTEVEQALKRCVKFFEKSCKMSSMS